MKSLILRGVEHPIVIPTSSATCLEAYQFIHKMEHSEGVPIRAYAAAIGLCCKSLRPSGLPKWDGSNAAQYGGLMADHLMGEHKLSVVVIRDIMLGTKIAELLAEGFKLTSDEVGWEVKNS
jgi:hypothetical protein